MTVTADPGWTPLLGMASGLVTEVGGLLSHSAIVAREFGIPAVAGVKGATKTIPGGSRVVVDGDQGRVAVTDLDDHKSTRKGRAMKLLTPKTNEVDLARLRAISPALEVVPAASIEEAVALSADVDASYTHLSPELIQGAKNLRWVQVASAGVERYLFPELVERDEAQFYGIRPRHIRPRWVTVPVLWALASAVPELIQVT